MTQKEKEKIFQMAYIYLQTSSYPFNLRESTSDNILFFAECFEALRVLKEELCANKPDSMDIWRENLKTWTLKRAGEKS